MKGRKPKPTHLKLVQGNPGGRKLNDAEPVAPAEVPQPPAYLSQGAREEWARTAPLLHDAKLISLLDKQQFGRLCQLVDRLHQAELKLAETGMLIRSPSGYPMQSPYLAIINTCGKQINTLCAEFGLTPSSRSRIRVDDKTPNDEFEKFLRDGAS